MSEFDSMVIVGDEWGLHPTSAQHIARRLARRGRVLYVNSAGIRPPTLTGYDLRRIASKLRAMARPLPPNGTMGFHSPFVIPFNNVGILRRWNRKHLIRSVRRQVQLHGLRAPVLFAVDPIAAEVAGNLNESLLVYYITDEYAELPKVFRNYVQELEELLLEQADVIFVSSRVLQSAKNGKKTRPVLLPHGVDFEHFSTVLRHPAAPPIEMRFLRRPIIGFYGLLAPWVDRSVIEALAASFRQGSIVLIGPMWAGYTLPRAPNIQYLGPRSYEELPNYAVHFDVALIPFVNNKLTENVNPLKFLEYLALGLPVVCSPLADLERFAPFYYRANGADEFTEQTRAALQQDSAQRHVERMAAASGESWESRVDIVVQAIRHARCGEAQWAA